MTLTATEIIARRSRVGASDIASIIGFPTFKGRNAYSAWLDKCGMLEDETSVPDYIEAGNLLEPVLLDFAEKQHGALDRNVVVHDPSGAPIASTLDGQVKANGRPVEVKTSGIFGPVQGDWGEEHSDEVPDGYVLQCQTQLLCTGADLCPLIALLGSRGFVEFHIEPHDGLMKTIRSVATDFFDRYVTPKRDPRGEWGERLRKVHGLELPGDPCEPVYETVKRIHRVTGKVIEATDEQTLNIRAWADKRTERLEIEKEEKALLALVLADADDAEFVLMQDGAEFSHKEQRGADIIDREAMKTAGIYEQYARGNRFRVPRIKELKTKGR